MNFLTYLIKQKNEFFKKTNIFYLILVSIIFFFDRFSKSKVIINFSESSYYVNDYINLDLIWNVGIGFGFLSTDSSLFYNLVTVLIGIVILSLVYVFIISENLDKIIYSIIIGGALGNFYDRLIYKAVPDFIDLHYANFHWFTFNVADIFITIGILIFIIRNFFVQN
jgi:signal peptidase II